MNLNNIEICKARTSDIEQLQQISKKTFIETFSTANTEENMNMYLKDQLCSEKLLKELKHPCSEFYLAFLNNEVIGYLKINYGKAQTVDMKNSSIEIERIYVKKEYYGKNIGQQFCDLTKEIANQKKVEFIWLGVWEKNPRAIAFYKKNGFRQYDQHIFKLGDDEQTDLLMRLDMANKTF